MSLTENHKSLLNFKNKFGSDLDSFVFQQIKIKVPGVKKNLKRSRR